MKLRKIYDCIVAEGINVDPRQRSLIDDELKKAGERYAALPEAQKEYFDQEALSNPYDDTRLLYGDPETDIKVIFAGIDIDAAELLVIDRLNAAKKERIDLAVAHHPQGRAFACFYEVMDMQADIYNGFGVPINITEKLVEERKSEVARRIHAANHHRAVDAARLLGIPFMCAHTPADNHAVYFLQKIFDENKPQTLKSIVEAIEQLEEYKAAKRFGVSPSIILGKPQSRSGKIFIDMTGGTEGPRDIIEPLLAAGVGTIVGMHLSEEHYKKFHDKNINVIIAGHIASDNLGMNLLFDKIEEAGDVQIIAASGFRRVKRS